MSAISLLILILAFLMVVVGGRKGITAFLSVVFNFVILFTVVILITGGLPPIWVSFFAGICILGITIYMGNSDEKTSNIAFKATLIVLAIMLLLIIPFDHFAQIKGFASEQSETIEAFDLLIGADFEAILISTTVLSTLGAIAEAAIAVASGLNEVIEQKPGITLPEVFKSGKMIGFQIMGMTFNTLFFGMFGSDLALFILLYKLDTDFSYYLNSKIFVKECLAVLFSSVAVILVIWITTYLVGKNLNEHRQKIDN
ncbi:MAG: YibE/F family protein [Lactobacillus sp.]|nr:YibE/F family protein [Lactobacillus sp.]